MHFLFFFSLTSKGAFHTSELHHFFGRLFLNFFLLCAPSPTKDPTGGARLPPSPSVSMIEIVNGSAALAF